MAPSDAAPALVRPEATPAADLAAPSSASQAPMRAPSSTPAPQPAPATGPSTASPATTTTSPTKAKEVAQPLVVYTGDLSMTVEQEKFSSTLDRVIDVAEALGGHLSGRKNNGVEIRVPSARFREAITKIEQIGIVTQQSVNAEDVSEEFHDLEVRLQNLRATRQRLQDFLAKANTIADTLTVERELERVAQEIDRMEGRLAFLRSRASMSRISVALTAKPKPEPIVVAPPPPPPPPPPARYVELPVDWLSKLGTDRLMDLSSR